MIAARSTNGSEPFLWEFESDLSTLACHAATELDNLLLGKPEQPEAVSRLVDQISRKIARRPSNGKFSFLVDPAIVGVINDALLNAEPHRRPPNSVNELIDEAAKIKDELAQILRQPDQTEPATLRRLRTFCLALSERASADEPSIDESEHSQEVGR